MKKEAYTFLKQSTRFFFDIFLTDFLKKHLVTTENLERIFSLEVGLPLSSTKIIQITPGPLLEMHIQKEANGQVRKWTNI